MPFPNDDAPRTTRAPRSYGGGTAYCVRGCDGRYFPAQGNDAESKAQSCKSFCPASETSLVYGSNIDDATTDSGKSYSDLPNAFRYRNEIVSRAAPATARIRPASPRQGRGRSDLAQGRHRRGQRRPRVANRNAKDAAASR